MNDLRWKLARLSVMSPLEVAHRARIATRDRLAPPAWSRVDARAAFARLFQGDAAGVLRSSRLGALVRSVEPGSCEDEITAARALLGGRWILFGREVRLADPPRWNENPLSGAAWPGRPSRTIDYHDTRLAGDPKLAWELGRLTVLPVLAQAARASGQRASADRAIRWLDDFTATQPLGSGIHHTSGMEQAVRTLTVTWTLALLGERAGEVALEPCLGLMAQQALHVRDHLSLGSSANNHLIAEYAAITVLAAAFPALRGADRLLREGVRGLERETLRQFDPDGVSREQSFGYLPLIWELLLESFVAAEAAGAKISDAVRARLAASLEFARVIRLQGGAWPRIGDEDDGRILMAGEHASRLDLVGNALAAWLGADGLADGERGLARLLIGAAPRARAAADGVTETADYTIWRAAGLVVTFDHGALGLAPLAAHGHGDALSITIHRGADAIVLDPGTFAYHADRAARDRCRSTPLHATIHFGARSQAEMAGPFLWRGRPDVKPDEEREGGWTCRWTSGELHRRRVLVAGDRVTIEDRVTGDAEAAVAFPLAPGAIVTVSGATARAEVGATQVSFESEGLEPWRIERGEIAPRFGRIEQAPRLVAALHGSECRTTIRIGGG